VDRVRHLKPPIYPLPQNPPHGARVMAPRSHPSPTCCFFHSSALMGSSEMALPVIPVIPTIMTLLFCGRLSNIPRYLPRTTRAASLLCILMRSAPVELCDCRDRGGRVLVELFARDQQNLDALGVLSLLATPRHRLGDVSTLLSGLIGPGDRKSIQPMAKRLGVWDAAPVETELLDERRLTADTIELARQYEVVDLTRSV